MIDIPLLQPGTGSEFVFHSEEAAADARRKGWTDPVPVPAATDEKPKSKRKK